MIFPKEAWQFTATIIAALIAGTVSFIVTVLAKEQKTSEFRQAWIDALRQDLSHYMSLIAVLYDTTQHRLRKGEAISKIADSVISGDQSDFKNIEAARLKILLRLNPQEHSRLIELINQAYTQSPANEASTPNAATQFLNEYIAECQRVLKAEWRRVKRGEPIFIGTKYAALIVVASLLMKFVLLPMLPQNNTSEALVVPPTTDRVPTPLPIQICNPHRQFQRLLIVQARVDGSTDQDAGSRPNLRACKISPFGRNDRWELIRRSQTL